jgi:hypothetical protein
MRITLQIPLKVRCQMPEGESIDLKAATHCVSASGALLVMDAPLLPGQMVQLLNESTSESVECYVTSVRERREVRYIGVGFSDPDTDFWHVVFPRAGTRQAVRSASTGGLVRPDTLRQNPPQI